MRWERSGKRMRGERKVGCGTSKAESVAAGVMKYGWMINI